ncbi:MAG TPA: ArsB/NhaD family transporter, partial [Phycisphaerae bacterium]|nr:ArsB/NhaD family transporter [Phycisphaerae bacterium]
TGMFEWLATLIAKAVRGNALLIFMLFLIITAVISSVLDNVTTVILIAPITILVCQVLELPAIPFLVFEALFSNIGGTATLVGDPPNVIIGSQAKLSFNEFIMHLTPVIVIVMIISLAVVYLWFGRKFKVRQSAREQIMKTNPSLAIIDRNNMIKGLCIFALVLAGFFLGRVLDIEPGIVALAGGMLMALVCRVEIHRVLGKVEWNTIMFFVGLFILIGSLEVNHVFEKMGQGMLWLTNGNLLMTVIVLLWFSAIASAIVDNIPLVIAMIPLIKSIIPDFAHNMGLDVASHQAQILISDPLYWSLALGACLGGNGTMVGASANVVICQIAKRNNYNITFMGFTKLGMPMMVLSLVICTCYLWLRYFVFNHV